MNKLYYIALGLALAFSVSQSPSLAQGTGQAAPTSQPTVNGGGQQTFSTSKQLLQNLPITRMGGLARNSAAGQGGLSSAPYSFGFTGGAASNNGGYSSLPPTATSSCLSIDILSGGGGGGSIGGGGGSAGSDGGDGGGDSGGGDAGGGASADSGF